MGTNNVHKVRSLPFSSADLIIEIDYSAGTNPIYLGKAVPGTLTSETGWQIFKCAWDANNNLTSKLAANGTNNYDKEWDERATYTYSAT